MSNGDRHINFELMRAHILSLQDDEAPRGGKNIGAARGVG